MRNTSYIPYLISSRFYPLLSHYERHMVETMAGPSPQDFRKRGQYWRGGGSVICGDRRNGKNRVKIQFVPTVWPRPELLLLREKDGREWDAIVCVHCCFCIMFGNEITCPRCSFLVNISSSNKLDLLRYLGSCSRLNSIMFISLC